jgi:hypothetical protein
MSFTRHATSRNQHATKHLRSPSMARHDHYVANESGAYSWIPEAARLGAA